MYKFEKSCKNQALSPTTCNTPIVPTSITATRSSVIHSKFDLEHCSDTKTTLRLVAREMKRWMEGFEGGGQQQKRSKRY